MKIVNDYSYFRNKLFTYGAKRTGAKMTRGRGPGPPTCNCTKKETLAQMFPVNFAKFLRIAFQQNASGRLFLISKG